MLTCRSATHDRPDHGSEFCFVNTHTTSLYRGGVWRCAPAQQHPEVSTPSCKPTGLNMEPKVRRGRYETKHIGAAEDVLACLLVAGASSGAGGGSDGNVGGGEGATARFF